LDKDSCGLLLFTNNTRFGDKVTSPLTKVQKTYHVEVDKPLKPDDRRLMESTFMLKDGTVLKPARLEVDVASGRRFRMTIDEGKNRQIRRMCEELGYQVQRLQRLKIGPVKLGNLTEGQVRPLTQAEVNALMAEDPIQYI
jgi:pseudouridine synthase